MEFGRRWKIRTSFGWVVVTLRAPAQAVPKRDAAARERERLARSYLRYEAAGSQENPSVPLRSLQDFLRGGASALPEYETPPTESEVELRALDTLLENELAAGRLELDFEPFWSESLTDKEREGEAPPLRALPPPEPETSFIAVNLIDQNGKPVIGRRWIIELPDGSRHEGITDAEGWARVKGFTQNGLAKVSFPQFDELDHETRVSSERIIEPVQGEAETETNEVEPEPENVAEPKPPKPPPPPAESSELPDLGELASAAELVDELPTSQPLGVGKIFMELWDAFGEERHANRNYTITGPVPFAGTTDASGRLEHAGVPAGDYVLQIALDDGEFASPALVQEVAVGAPHVRFVGPGKSAVVARLIGMFFDTDKSFLLPSAVPAIREVRRLYDQHPASKLLIVGHTDTAGKPSYNDPLSLERADAISAFLQDQAELWLAWYGANKPAEKRWGDAEDTSMIGALADAAARPTTEAPMAWFRRTRNLTSTSLRDVRLTLIREYMSADGTSLPKDIEVTTHGCGENFPAVTTGDNVDLQDNRRVELFFFDDAIKPPPPGRNSQRGSPEYPKWLASVRETFDLRIGAAHDEHRGCVVRRRALSRSQRRRRRIDGRRQRGGALRDQGSAFRRARPCLRRARHEFAAGSGGHSEGERLRGHHSHRTVFTEAAL